jgi:hypothetical protein
VLPHNKALQPTPLCGEQNRSVLKDGIGSIAFPI